MPNASTDKTWNVMVRSPTEAHFTPLWATGVHEHDARHYFIERCASRHYRGYDIQLVHEFSSHVEPMQIPTLNGTVTTNKHIIDGWKAVDSNVI